MQKCFSITAATVCLFVAHLAWAQPVQQDRQGFTPTVNLTMEQKHIIKETVKELKIEGAAADLEWLLAKPYRKLSNYIQCRHNFPKRFRTSRIICFFSRVHK